MLSYVQRIILLSVPVCSNADIRGYTTVQCCNTSQKERHLIYLRSSNIHCFTASTETKDVQLFTGCSKYVTYHDNREITDRIPAEVGDFSLFQNTRMVSAVHLCVLGVHSQLPALLSPSSRYPNIIRVYNHSTHHFHARFSLSPVLST